MTMQAGNFTTTLPKYRSHKVVQAARIVAIDHGERLDLAPFGVIEVGAQWIKEKRAEVGGYFVQYADGYTSYSPEKAFVEGYYEIEQRTRGLTGNPNHEVSRAMEGQWHKIVALLMARMEETAITISPPEVNNLIATVDGHAVTIKMSDRIGLELRLVTGEEAERVAREEGGLPA